MDLDTGECAMKERPILFSGEMVCTILDGRKTQTRRVAKPQPLDGPLRLASRSSITKQDKRKLGIPVSPYGESAGDRLWVKETWASVSNRPDCQLAYRADGDAGVWMTEPKAEKGMLWHSVGNIAQLGLAGFGGRWRPSIFMPRWASRLTLELTAEPRLERLWSISEEDAVAEGTQPLGSAVGRDQPFAGGPPGWTHGTHPHALGFACLWDAINDERSGCSWAHNPLVWVVSFRRVTDASGSLARGPR
jgi:hypothetical protein